MKAQFQTYGSQSKPKYKFTKARAQKTNGICWWFYIFLMEAKVSPNINLLKLKKAQAR